MNLKKIAAESPREPGVYIMRDHENRIIYVGKARILRNRLSSYFSGEKDIKTRTLLRHAASIETIIVKDEYEALLLENTLIKQHSPKYNINLKDGKTYPVIRLTKETYPRIFRTRHIVEDGSDYYGPFPNVSAMDNMLDVVKRVFPLRKCRIFKARNSPCMYYHIGRCSAPCCKKGSPELYGLQVERVKKLLSGETAGLIEELTAEMKKEAAELRFEKAAQLRNAIKTVEGLEESSAVVDRDPDSRDYIAWAADGVLAAFSVFSMREGKLTGRELYHTRSAADEWESLELFITSYYDNSRPPPPKIFFQTNDSNSIPQRRKDAGNAKKIITNANSAPLRLCVNIFENNLLSSWFEEKFGFAPELVTSSEKHHDAILAMARLNAEEELKRRLGERGLGPALEDLKNLLGLKNRPLRIEGFDISQLDGKHPVASLVCFQDGKPDKKNYRHFKLRTVIGVVDDFAAMREAVERRYSRQLRENRELPDLVLVDGGIGQVNAAKGVLDKLGLDCDAAGLAKREEEIWLPNAKEPLRLEKKSEALRLLEFVRDETHRFATKLNQKLRSKDLRMETLESVEGIGPKRAAALMGHYRNIGAIAAAEAEEIAQVCDCGPAAARAVRAAAGLAATERKYRLHSTGSLAELAAESEEEYKP